jgi:hypothetical protein
MFRFFSHLVPKGAAFLYDLENCYGLLIRMIFLAACRRMFPSLSRYIYSQYKDPKRISYDGNIIEAGTGTTQGDGLGPLLCAAGTGEIFMEMASVVEAKGLSMGNAFIDDLALVGSEAGGVEALALCKEKGPTACGAHPNVGKCLSFPVSILRGEAAGPAPPNFPSAVKRLTGATGLEVGGNREPDGTRLVGSPLGSAAYCSQYVRDMMERKYHPILAKLEDLNHPHAAWRGYQVLQLSGGLVHLFHTTPPDLIVAEFGEIERRIRSFFELAVVGRVLTDLQWKYAQLPYSEGGWNFIPPRVQSFAGYLSSLKACRPLIVQRLPMVADNVDKEIVRVIELITTHFPSSKPDELLALTSQRDITRHLMAKQVEDVYNEADQGFRALILGQRQEKANSWKTAAQTAEMFMDGHAFQLCACRSLRVPLYPPRHYSSLLFCDVNPFGDEALSAMKEGGVVQRHNELNKVIAREARHALLGASVDDQAIPLPNNETYRPDILFSMPFPGLTTRPTALDLVVTSNFAKTEIKRAAKEPLSAARSGHERKLRENSDRLDKVGFDFLPMALETTGGHMPTVVSVMHHILGQKAIVKDLPFGELTSAFWQRFSVTQQKTQATMLMRAFNVPDTEA